MKKGLLVGSVVLSGALFATNAHAFQFGTPPARRPYRSAQNFALELRFSPYSPNVDDDPSLGGRKPYEQNFGTTPRFLPALELDWQTFRIPYVGTIGPGIGVGYTRMSADSLTVTGRKSGDSTALEILPLWASFVLRVDTLWHDAGIPIVPYGKAGIGLAFWRASNTGDTSVFNGKSGKGHSLGTHFALGLAFALNALDQGASRNMDNATGINGTFLFAEMYWLTLDGFGARDSLRVGANTWAAGLLFEF